MALFIRTLKKSEKPRRIVIRIIVGIQVPWDLLVMPLLLLQSVTKTCQLGPLNSCLLLVRLSVVFPKCKPDHVIPLLNNLQHLCF